MKTERSGESDGKRREMRARIGKGKQREPRNGLSQEAEVTEVGARRGDGLKEVMGGRVGGRRRAGERQRREIGMVGEERGERRKGMGSTDEGERERDGGGAE